MTVGHSSEAADRLRGALCRACLADEDAAVQALIDQNVLPPDAQGRVKAEVGRLVAHIRSRPPQGLDAFLQEYGLSSQEGVVLMCLAEALLRIPDDRTRTLLIRDKIVPAHWDHHLGRSGSLMVNVSTWALMLTGRLLPAGEAPSVDQVPGLWRRMVSRSGEAVVRRAIVQAMRIIGRQFVMAETIGEALERAHADEVTGYRHSFDMLGEAACTGEMAEGYLAAYSNAIAYIGCVGKGRGPVLGPGLSVKLSALHPRYEFAQRERVVEELVPRFLTLVEAAAAKDIALCIDAEEADRLDLSLDVVRLAFERMPRGWEGFGLAVQAYQKRAPLVIDWLIEAARSHRRKLQIRLVKGAYWDSEIKRAQERGLPGYPVYTRKQSTDLSYLVCVKRLAAAGDTVYPQFATHNVHTVAAVREIMGPGGIYEFQRLHGMGAQLHDKIVAEGGACRIYAPVGSHEDLVPYLVRRLLENGANGSFVNRLADATAPVEVLAADPARFLRAQGAKAHPKIPLPADLYRPERQNSAGSDLSDPLTVGRLMADVAGAMAHERLAVPLIDGKELEGAMRLVIDPSDSRRLVGRVFEAGEAAAERALSVVAAAAPGWDRTDVAERAAMLERAAELYQAHTAELLALCIREAGKTIPDALAEVRESVDFLRYYAARAKADFASEGLDLPGPTGEINRLRLRGRGVFVCISPWNFPLAIFTGQVAAALAAGNAVIAKPAPQTPLIAALAVRLLHEAGIGGDVLALLPGGGDLGARLVSDARIAGVAFTGSNETAWAIQKRLADRHGPIVPLIAETGGLNAMIVDSSALAEQVTRDALVSAFSCAGQRCSALRLLFLQDDIADRVLTMLAGAMRELAVGDPALPSSDIGPVIDQEALSRLERHALRMAREGRLLSETRLPGDLADGFFFAPRLVEISDPRRLDGEVFGPILHVVRYPASGLADVLSWLSTCGYGLTLGIHSRIEATVRFIVDRARVGNVYVNRGMIGAVVGSQPFGGEGLSGTGPKSGGPRTLYRFATERAVSVNIVAAGGNPSLLSLDDGADESASPS
ncbi:bifunctional proline dehydrogenase/L-glutamate gamma-semialdehyde dehydrogenase PutA [Telmatospirillum siberiense]|uniref:Bifunctional protein PutA n=1 Tax=Telmatospirillum siberiense TaxID=382514 RepID=A0A2N3PM05_9PROT|nr:bifunctional proline dehydrogenase/L-glutamate gamma-semialdehyde dehydrogenase PutA [Telmatospirillum siberiense]PKU21434.1 bifunctional proline dehydrogenase/L-glutamate gamma-semialdehyde dehydrogenase [Telmatospirillum siberiense]